jgi:multicomponent Na+:H+ antiporter subunit E
VKACEAAAHQHARTLVWRSQRDALCDQDNIDAMDPASSKGSARSPRGFVSLWLLLTFIWCAANSSFSIAPIVTGVLISAALAFVFTKNSDVWHDVAISPGRVYHFIMYTGVLVVELVRANLRMLGYVYAPRIRIKPGVVKIRTGLKSPVGRLALANSIALTPGSLVLEVDGDILFVHLLDVQTANPADATRMIAEPFERHLEKVFG